MISSSSIRNAIMLCDIVLLSLWSLLIRIKIRGVIESSRYRAKLELDLKIVFLFTSNLFHFFSLCVFVNLQKLNICYVGSYNELRKYKHIFKKWFLHIFF